MLGCVNNADFENKNSKWQFSLDMYIKMCLLFAKNYIFTHMHTKSAQNMTLILMYARCSNRLKSILHDA